MTVYIGLIIITFLLNQLFKYNIYDSEDRLYYVVSIGFVFFLIASLRSINVGTDVANYVGSFYEMRFYDFEGLVVFKDFGFQAFAKTMNNMTDNHQLYLAFIAAFFMISVSVLVYKYSVFPLISFFMLLPFGYYYFSMTGLRQTMAISFILFSYKYILQRNIFKFLILIGCAYLMHSSSFIFVIAYFLFSVKTDWRLLIIFLIFWVLIIININEVINFTVNVLDENESIKDYSIQNRGQGIVSLIMYCFIYVSGLIVYKKMKLRYEGVDLLMNLALVAIFFQSFVPFLDEFFRVSLYFNIFFLLLIPKIIFGFIDSNSKNLIYSVVFALFFILYFGFTYNAAGAYPYEFFWEEGEL